MPHDNTSNIRISSTLLDGARVISKKNGQTISGYINRILAKQIEKDLAKYFKYDNKNNIKDNSTNAC